MASPAEVPSAEQQRGDGGANLRGGQTALSLNWFKLGELQYSRFIFNVLKLYWSHKVIWPLRSLSVSKIHTHTHPHTRAVCLAQKPGATQCQVGGLFRPPLGERASGLGQTSAPPVRGPHTEKAPRKGGGACTSHSERLGIISHSARAPWDCISPR